MRLSGHCHFCGLELSAKYSAHKAPVRMYCNAACMFARVPMLDHGDATCSHQPADMVRCGRRHGDGYAGGQVGRKSCGKGHGQPWSYAEGCRCPMCTDANRRECVRLKIPRYIARAAGEEVPAPHGSVSAYTNHGCRCDVCRVGHSERLKVYRAIRRAPYVATLVP